MSGDALEPWPEAPREALLNELVASYRRFDLQPRDLLALDRSPLPVCPNVYWSEEALPRAHLLVGAVLDLLDRHVPMGVDHATGADMERCTDLRPPVPIRQLSAWWQRRLRRAALARSIPAVLLATPIDVGLVVARTEMALLAAAPWSHADRLLSAFELAHIEIGHRVRGEPVSTPSFFRHA